MSDLKKELYLLAASGRIPLRHPPPEAWLADRLGVTRQAVYAWTRGDSQPRNPDAVRAALDEEWAKCVKCEGSGAVAGREPLPWREEEWRRCPDCHGSGQSEVEE